MKRLLCFLVVTIMICAVCFNVSATTVYRVILNLSFASNLLFSKYDVDLYLNDLKLEHLSHGQDYSDSFFVEGGTNHIYFYNSGNKKIMGSINFDVTGNTIINCSISCTKDEIKVNPKIEINEGEYVYSSRENKDTSLPTENSTAGDNQGARAEDTNATDNPDTLLIETENRNNNEVASIPFETAKKAVLAGICNHRALDVYTEDGNFYDRAKFHSYEKFYDKWVVLDEGEWTLIDNNDAWHVSDFLIHDKDLNKQWFFKYSFDVRFDGKNYRLENGWLLGAYSMKYFDKSDGSRYDESDLSDLEFNTIFIIEPWQIGE